MGTPDSHTATHMLYTSENAFLVVSQHRLHFPKKKAECAQTHITKQMSWILFPKARQLIVIFLGNLNFVFWLIWNVKREIGGEREKEGERENLLSFGSCSKYPPQLELAQPRARSQAHPLGHPHRRQGLMYLNHHLLPPRKCIIRRLEWESKSQNSNRTLWYCNAGIPSCDLTSGPNACPLIYTTWKYTNFKKLLRSKIRVSCTF